MSTSTLCARFNGLSRLPDTFLTGRPRRSGRPAFSSIRGATCADANPTVPLDFIRALTVDSEGSNVRGRKPYGPSAVGRLAGSPQARERLRLVLETLAGTCRVQEACARLGLSEQRFDQLRTQWRMGIGGQVLGSVEFTTIL
jgi:hypothetical protein